MDNDRHTAIHDTPFRSFEDWYAQMGHVITMASKDDLRIAYYAGALWAAMQAKQIVEGERDEE